MPISCRVRTGIILHIEGVDMRSKYGIPIDEGLITSIDGRDFIRLDPRHYQIATIFGTEKLDSPLPNRWIMLLKALREAATVTQLKVAFKSLDEDCNVDWNPKLKKREELIDKIPKILEITMPATTDTNILTISVAMERCSQQQLRVEVTDENIAILVAAFYCDPPQHNASPSKGTRAPPAYPEFPDVHTTTTRGAKIVYITARSANVSKTYRTLYRPARNLGGGAANGRRASSRIQQTAEGSTSSGHATRRRPGARGK